MLALGPPGGRLMLQAERHLRKLPEGSRGRGIGAPGPNPAARVHVTNAEYTSCVEETIYHKPEDKSPPQLEEVKWHFETECATNVFYVN